MKTLSSDTHPKIEQILIEGYRKMSPTEKWERVRELHLFAEALAMADVRRRYPEADDRECRLRVASRRIPVDLMKKAFGWDVEEKGY